MIPVQRHRVHISTEISGAERAEATDPMVSGTTVDNPKETNKEETVGK